GPDRPLANVSPSDSPSSAGARGPRELVCNDHGRAKKKGGRDPGQRGLGRAAVSVCEGQRKRVAGGCTEAFVLCTDDARGDRGSFRLHHSARSRDDGVGYLGTLRQYGQSVRRLPSQLRLWDADGRVAICARRWMSSVYYFGQTARRGLDRL